MARKKLTKQAVKEEIKRHKKELAHDLRMYDREFGLVGTKAFNRVIN